MCIPIGIWTSWRIRKRTYLPVFDGNQPGKPQKILLPAHLHQGQQAEKEKKRFAEKGEHTFRQKVCKICGKPFWPSNGQEVLCSEECKTINRRQKQLAYYYRKQSGQKAGEAI